jgi:hypothetical protein
MESVLSLINRNMDKEKLVLTNKQAIELLSKDKMIHTFRSTGFALIGADWRRSELVKTIKASTDPCEIGGEMCKKMGHALVIWTGNEPLFVEVSKEKVELLESKTAAV